DRLQEEKENLGRIRRGEHVGRFETVRRHRDGSFIDVSVTMSPVRNVRGKIIGASTVARDITERKRAEEQQTLILPELDHRIRNSLATIQAIATQTFRGASDEEKAAFAGRIQALAKAQALLSGGSWRGAPLREVVTRSLDAFSDTDGSRIKVSGTDAGFLDSTRGFRLTIALHELATNAVKYGALSNGTGRVSITWDVLREGATRRVLLRWQESGGPPVTPPERKGFGSRLLDQILEGEQSSGY